MSITITAVSSGTSGFKGLLTRGGNSGTVNRDLSQDDSCNRRGKRVKLKDNLEISQRKNSTGRRGR